MSKKKINLARDLPLHYSPMGIDCPMSDEEVRKNIADQSKTEYTLFGIPLIPLVVVTLIGALAVPLCAWLALP